MSSTEKKPGAEKSKIPFSMIGHIFGDDGYKDEVKVVKQITDLRNKYLDHQVRMLFSLLSWMNMD